LSRRRKSRPASRISSNRARSQPRTRREFDDASSKLGDRARDFLSSFDHKYAARIEALEERVAALEGKAPKETSRRARP
jgi:hypothetical protein